MTVVVKDAMVLIHLAKLTLLETACIYFGRVVVAQQVFEETAQDNPYEDAGVIRALVEKSIIRVQPARKELIVKANQFNVKKGEAEALALYWQLPADLLASDDDNLRKKRELLNLKLIGTPTIILKLYREKKISKEKFIGAMNTLKKIGWFHPSVLDKLLEG